MTAIDGGGNVTEQYSRIIAVWLECFPGESNFCWNE